MLFRLHSKLSPSVQYYLSGLNTQEAFKFAWHIVSTSPGEENLKAVSKVVCEECKEFFIDESDEDEKYICFTCRGI